MTVTFDPTDGHVYVGDETPSPEIREYDPSQPISQALLDTFGAGHVERVAGLTAGPSGTIYAADLLNEAVEMFGPDVILPNVSVTTTEDRKTSATLTGRVDPAGGGEVTGCKFEYGTSTSYGQSVPCSPEPPYQSATNVAANVTGLSEGVTYHFRLVSANANGADEGEDHVFGPPAIDGESATAATTTPPPTRRSTLPASPRRARCSMPPKRRSRQPATPARRVRRARTKWDGKRANAAVAATLAGLQLDTTYHYRFIASSGAGVATGEDRTFATFGFSAFRSLP